MRDEATLAPAAADDWAAQAADSIEHVVTALRDKTAVPLTTVARTIVYGLLAAMVAGAGMVVLAIGAVRAVDVYLPEDVWAAHLLVGGIFTLLGLFLWARRSRRS